MSDQAQPAWRRQFWAATAAGTIALLTIVAIWAISEYHNAGGWPAKGFSQASGSHEVWNIWVIYPAIAWAFLTIVYALAVFARRPASPTPGRDPGTGRSPHIGKAGNR